MKNNTVKKIFASAATLFVIAASACSNSSTSQQEKEDEVYNLSCKKPDGTMYAGQNKNGLVNQGAYVTFTDKNGCIINSSVNCFAIKCPGK